ncbi:MAG: hypothetical protein ACYTEQ_29830 [Planctomycetota bacterium]|jgi:hypothetical protein
MELAEIKELVEKYGDALKDEFRTERKKEMLAVLVLSETEIDGKNAETRKRQAEQALSGSSEYQAAVDSAADAATARRMADAEIGLTKAWLYSQAPRF